MLLRHPSADDEQVRAEEHLDVAVVALEALGPLLPAHVVDLPLAGGGARLGVVAVDLQVTELGVGHQGAVDDDGRADARAQGGDDDGVGHAFGGVVDDLG